METFMTSFEEIGRAKGLVEGLAKGRAEGLTEGQREIVVRLPTCKIDALREAEHERISALNTESGDRLRQPGRSDRLARRAWRVIR